MRWFKRTDRAEDRLIGFANSIEKSLSDNGMYDKEIFIAGEAVDGIHYTTVGQVMASRIQPGELARVITLEIEHP